MDPTTACPSSQLRANGPAGPHNGAMGTESPHIPNNTEPRDARDEGLLARIAGGDASALRALIARYDRLVRFTIFRLSRDRCVRDPQWLDSLASETWTAFVDQARVQCGAIPSPRALLYAIARNRTVSALRKVIREQSRDPSPGTHPAGTEPDEGGEAEDPLSLLARLEDLAALQACREQLTDDDRRVLAQLKAILDRRWQAAAEGLGIPESTLRSRWKNILGQLRRCLEGKTGRDVAPPDRPSDS